MITNVCNLPDPDTLFTLDTEEECVLFEEILEVDNPDLFHWLSAQKPAPEKMLENSVYLMLAEYVNSEHPDIMRRMSTQNQNL